MALTGDHPADIAALVGDALVGVGWPVHLPPVPDTTIAPPCVIVSPPAPTFPLGTLGCPNWSFEVRLLAIGADPNGRDLMDVCADTMQALWTAGLSTTATLRTWQPPNTPAGIPAYEILIEATP